jgi:hypothetical protein
VCTSSERPHEQFVAMYGLACVRRKAANVPERVLLTATAKCLIEYVH